MILLLNRQAVAVELLESGARDIARALGIERRDVEMKVVLGMDGLLMPHVSIAEAALVKSEITPTEASGRLIVLFRALKRELNERLEGALQRRPGLV